MARARHTWQCPISRASVWAWVISVWAWARPHGSRLVLGKVPRQFRARARDRERLRVRVRCKFRVRAYGSVQGPGLGGRFMMEMLDQGLGLVAGSRLRVNGLWPGSWLVMKTSRVNRVMYGYVGLHRRAMHVYIGLSRVVYRAGC